MGFTLGQSYSGTTYIGTQVGAWTTFTASAGTDKYFVRSSGNNSTAAKNDSTKPWATVSGSNGALSAMKTAQAASGTATEGLPNWLLIAEGDVFVDDYFDVNVADGFQVSGKNTSERLIITSYDTSNPNGTPHPATSPRPRFYVPNADPSFGSACNGLLTASSINGLHGGQYVAIIGIDLYSYQRDPANTSTFSASVSGSTFTASSVTGFISLGATVKGTAVPGGTKIISGPLTGGAGTYTCNNDLTGSTPNAADAFAPANSASLLGGAGIKLNSDFIDSFCIEDCMVQYFASNIDMINLAFSHTPFTNIAVRRNVIIDAFNVISGGSLSQGYHSSGVLAPIVEENFFDHNGQNDYSGAGATDRNRNLYFSAYGWANNGPTTGAIYKGNISTRSSSSGCQFRGDGAVAYDCFWGRNMNGFEVGHQEMDQLGWGSNPSVTNMNITRQVVTESEDRPTIGDGGQGIFFNNMYGSGNILTDIIITKGTSVSVNAIAIETNSPYTVTTLNDSGTGTSAGTTLTITGGTDDFEASWSYPTVTFTGVGSGTTLTVSNPTGPVIIGSAISGTGISAGTIITAQQADGNQARAAGNYTTNNSVTGVNTNVTCVPPTGSSISGTGVPANTVFVTGGFSAGTFTTNNVTTCAGDTVSATMNVLTTAGIHGLNIGSSVIVSNWHITSDDSYDNHGAVNSINPATSGSWPDPNRTMGTYDTTLGGDGTSDNLIARWRTQSKYSWNYNLTSNAIVNYFFVGFGIGGGSSVGTKLISPLLYRTRLKAFALLAAIIAKNPVITRRGTQ